MSEHDPWPPAIPVGYRCRRRNRCADRVTLRDPATSDLIGHAGAELDDYDGLCAACTRAVAAAVRGLAYDYAELHLALGRIGRSPSDWTTAAVANSAQGPPVPIAVGLEALARDVVEQATRWAQIVADTHGLHSTPAPSERAVHELAEATVAVRTGRSRRLYDLGDRARSAVLAAARAALAAHAGSVCHGEEPDPYDDGRLAVRLGRAVRLLSHPTSLATLLTLPGCDVMTWHRQQPDLQVLDGIQGALRLLALHEQVEHACGRVELVHRLPAHCPRCERPSLVRRNGKSYVECTRCGDEAPESHYSWLVRVLADEAADQRPDLARMTA